ncbi:type I-E CRISPR-associated protein Cse1/CasA [Longispora sp. K20-0274]|uniref:type I-E CRISPR-associated protein Cse1/CasA n=1 Tax=Longispora sp. K20-0274 TaxID=3088255 RepID=UPI00399A7A93
MSFDLTSCPWILVQRFNGRVEEVSVPQLFAEANEIRAVVGELPTQSFAVLRVLLAILHRSVDGPSSPGAWQRLWSAKTLPLADVEGYLEDWRHRFDLLSGQAPFFQVPDLRTAKDEVFGLERLIADVPTGEPFLTGRWGAELRSLRPAEAARWVVHCQAFDVSGIKSGAVDDDRVKGGKGYPIGTGFTGTLGGLFVEGDTLHDTLLLNLVPDGLDYVRRDTDDAPAWERDPDGPGSDSPQPTGLLSLYTWQSRRIRLFGDAEAVTGVLITNGDKLPVANLHQMEPMSPWRRSPNQEKALKIPTVYVPRGHLAGRALWRGLESLLPGTASRSRQADAPTVVDPGVLEWLGTATNREFLDSSVRVRLHAVGAVYGTQQSVIDELIDDTLTMSARVLASADLAVAARDAAADAEAAVKCLTGLAVNLLRAAGLREDKGFEGARERVSQAAYSDLDQQFRRWVATLDSDMDVARARTVWQQVALRVVRSHGDRLVDTAGPAAWVGRDVDGKPFSSGLADVWFRRSLHQALPLAVERLPANVNANVELEAVHT